jgi:hypothetical protein
VLLAGLLLSGAPTAAPTAAQEQPCEFVLGFQALHDLIPQIVGECLADQESNPANGDALQQTAGGLMAWRKADNWTAFTDGTTTWINGPQGLQSRPNAERFAWEPVAVPVPVVPVEPAAHPAPQPQPAPQPAAQAPGPIQRNPADFLLGPNDVGKEITRMSEENGTVDRATWNSVRWHRHEDLINSGLGPLKIYNRAYVAENIDAAKAIFTQQVEQQKRFPESQDRFEGIFTPGQDGEPAVARVADDQHSLAACNDDCNTTAFNRLHQRTVFRVQNVVGVLYFYGSDGAADVDQLNEWMRVLTGRIS